MPVNDVMLGPPPAPQGLERDTRLRTLRWFVASVVAFAVVELAMWTSGVADVLGTFESSDVGWVFGFVAFGLAEWVGRRATEEDRRATQVGGLGLLVVADAFLFSAVVPAFVGPRGDVVVLAATVLTAVAGVVVAVLAMSVNADAGRLRAYVAWAGFLVLAGVALDAVDLLRLWTWVRLAVVAVAGAAALHRAPRLHGLPSGQEVRAAASLLRWGP